MIAKLKYKPKFPLYATYNIGNKEIDLCLGQNDIVELDCSELNIKNLIECGVLEVLTESKQTNKNKN